MALVGKFESHVNGVTEEISKYWAVNTAIIQAFQLWIQRILLKANLQT